MAKRERVHGVPDYYDGVLSGVADFEGQPHAFMIDGDFDCVARIYRLAPISADAL
jgi:hypothetical protein